jgi:hypothetical protein
MPNESVKVNIWERIADSRTEDELDMNTPYGRTESDIRILYHKLKKQQNEAQFIRDSENYFRTGLNRPKCITEREMMMMMNF